MKKYFKILTIIIITLCFFILSTKAQEPEPTYCTPGDTQCNGDTNSSRADLQTACNKYPGKYWRQKGHSSSTEGGGRCVPKLCIGHSDKYCEAASKGTKKEVLDKEECLGNYGDPKKGDDKFCTCIAEGGTELAVKIPFVSETRCIPKEESGSALPIFMGAIIKLLNTFILVIGFAMLVRAGVLYASQNPKKAKSIIIGVVVGFALYGSLGIILRLINPIMFQ